MNHKNILICGLPESGKTTFLAALWHSVTHTKTTALKFVTLSRGDNTHLNLLAEIWREARVQIHTESGPPQEVTISLVGNDSQPVQITFPDLSGELFNNMWEGRDCPASLAEIINRSDGILFFLNANSIKTGRLLLDDIALTNITGSKLPKGNDTKWEPRLAPTQVKAVDLLQCFCSSVFNMKPCKVALILSAWDKAEDEQLNPEQFLAQHLPLLEQYLTAASHSWDWRVYGLSAQGGEYLNVQIKQTKKQLADVERLRNLNNPVDRIKLVFDGTSHKDLTEPIAWLMT